MNFMYKLERKFGRFAIRNLSLILVLCYGAGFLITYINPRFLTYLTLDPYAIIHGQVWRLFTWIIIPPYETNILFALLMMFFYYSIGTTLEKTWGAFQYNLFIFSGMFFTVLGSFLMMGYCYIFRAEDLKLYEYVVNETVIKGEGAYFRFVSSYFSTYYVNMSIFLAYATTFPEHRILLMFFIPVKMKVMGIIYAAFLAYDLGQSIAFGGSFGYVTPFVIGSSLLNFLVFFFTTRRYIRMNKTQRKFHKEIKKSVKAERRNVANPIIKHKCAVCGRTELDGEDIVFRYCSKCNGNFEFCQEHLYTHVHKE